MRFRRRRFNLSGFNLTETAIVLAIAGAVVGSIMAAYGTYRENREVSGIIADVLFLGGKLAEKFPASSFPEDGNEDWSAALEALAVGAFPENWGITGVTVNEPYDTIRGDAFLIRYGTQYAGPSTWRGTWRLVIYEVKRSVCIRLISALAPIAMKQDGVIKTLQVREGGSYIDYSVNDISSPPFDPPQCAVTANQIGIVFRN